MIDALIPLGPNDHSLVKLTARSIRCFVEGVRTVYIVSREDPKIPDTVFIDESLFPFNLADVQRMLGVDKRAGWYLQQLIKLYFPKVVLNASPRYLVADADTIFLRPCHFVMDGRVVFNFGTEYHHPYFDHMARLHPGLKKSFIYSGISHCMLFDRQWLSELFSVVEANHNGSPFWKVFLDCVDPAHKEGSGASEYETYFNFCLLTHPGDIIIKQLRWANAGDANSVRPDLHDYASLHWYGRSASLNEEEIERKVFGFPTS